MEEMDFDEPWAVDDLDGIIPAVRVHRNLSESSTARSAGGFPYPPEAPTVWIKYNTNYIAIRQQAETQQFAYENLRCPGIRVPKVYRVHEIPPRDDSNDSSWGMVIMELIKGAKIKYPLEDGEGTKVEVDFAVRMADALVALATLSPPSDADPAPGPVGGGRISNLVWGSLETRSTTEFQTVQELQDFVNTEIENVPFMRKADFINDKLCLCYGDIKDSHFLVSDVSDPQSDITILDFEHTNWLPISFLFWELSCRAFEESTYRFVFHAVKSKLPGMAVNDDNIQALRCFRWKREGRGSRLTPKDAKFSNLL